MRLNPLKISKLLIYCIIICNIKFSISQIHTDIIPAKYNPKYSEWAKAGCPVLTSGTGIKIANFIDATEYGVKNDNCVTDNTAALNGIISSIVSSPKKFTIIYFPAGAYLFNGEIDINKKRIILKGDGGAEDAASQTHFHV